MQKSESRSKGSGLLKKTPHEYISGEQDDDDLDAIDINKITSQQTQSQEEETKVHDESYEELFDNEEEVPDEGV